VVVVPGLQGGSLFDYGDLEESDTVGQNSFSSVGSFVASRCAATRASSRHDVRLGGIMVLSLVPRFATWFYHGLKYGGLPWFCTRWWKQSCWEDLAIETDSETEIDMVLICSSHGVEVV